MAIYEDPEFLQALEKIFAHRNDIMAIADYQQKLYKSLAELTASHRAVHEHVRSLTESHNRGQDHAETLQRARRDLEVLLKNLEQSHGQTQRDLRQAVNSLNFIQQEIRKVPLLEDRIERLQRELEKFKQEMSRDDRKDSEQDQRLRKLEQR